MLFMPMWNQLILGAVLGLGLSLVLIRLIAPLGWMDSPDLHRKHHARPTSRTGGAALWGVLILVQTTNPASFGLELVDWLAIHTMAFTGLLDDRFGLRARYKAIAGLAVALVLAVHETQTLGQTVDSIPFLGMMLPSHPLVIAPLLMLWFWALPQAYNLIDGINGLSMGLGAILLGVLGWRLGTQPALLWGGLAAVMVLNFPKAYHFLGDCGALMLGTLFAILGVKSFATTAPDLLLWVFAYPITDVCLVVCIRGWKGTPLGNADRSHLHHWMMDRVGHRSWVATPILLGLAALPMTRALAFPGNMAASTLGITVLVLLALRAFKDRVQEHEKTAKVTTQVRREIPLLDSGAQRVREISGSHPRF
jgi:UDP-GlcNAc:undecaprenyl-phosphate GlcNAc-1-phosphate transferase